MARPARVDWLEVGFALLQRAGHGALGIEPLCAAAGVTRGSFYHHYADLDAFVLALLAAFRQRHTEDVIARTDAAGAGRHATLDRLALELDLVLERRMRDWAGHDARVAAALAEIDRRRIGYLAEVIAECAGVGAATARDLALVEYTIFLGAQQLGDPADLARLRRLAPSIELTLGRAGRARRARASKARCATLVGATARSGARRRRPGDPSV